MVGWRSSPKHFFSLFVHINYKNLVALYTNLKPLSPREALTNFLKNLKWHTWLSVHFCSASISLFMNILATAKFFLICSRPGKAVQPWNYPTNWHWQRNPLADKKKHGKIWTPPGCMYLPIHSFFKNLSSIWVSQISYISQI